MGNITESIDKITSLLKDDIVDSVLKEYFQLLKHHAGLLEKRLGDLENENKGLRDENIRLASLYETRAQVDAMDFVEARGAYFLRKADGRFCETPYCLICKSPMSDVFGSTYHCSPCSHTWGYTRNDAEMTVKELENNG